MISYSLYLHIPFCLHKCSYCDFNTYAGLESLMGEYVAALCREIALLGTAAGVRLPVHTVFFGGGTPSLLAGADLERILRMIDDHFDLQAGLEITLEANPGTLSPEGLAQLSDLGVNRLSLGMQSAHPQELELMERQHNHADVIQAVTWVRKAGFGNLNLDLIFGLPGQTFDRWQWTVNQALGLTPEHFSLYALTLEHGTPLESWVNRGLVCAPEPDLAAQMYEWAADRLDTAGFHQYEISNWAVEGSGGLMACRHNLQYWRNRPYLGLGAGAHGFAGGVRTANVLGPAAYIQRLLGGHARRFPLTPASADCIPVDRRTEMQETMLMGLRLTDEGVGQTIFEERFGISIEEAFPQEIATLVDQGLLTWSGETLRLTQNGRLLGNQVFRRFV